MEQPYLGVLLLQRAYLWQDRMKVMDFGLAIDFTFKPVGIPFHTYPLPSIHHGNLYRIEKAPVTPCSRDNVALREVLLRREENRE